MTHKKAAHLCDDCTQDSATCDATKIEDSATRDVIKIVRGIDRHPEARDADADRILECDAYQQES